MALRMTTSVESFLENLTLIKSAIRTLFQQQLEAENEGREPELDQESLQLFRSFDDFHSLITREHISLWKATKNFFDQELMDLVLQLVSKASFAQRYPAIHSIAGALARNSTARELLWKNEIISNLKRDMKKFEEDAKVQGYCCMLFRTLCYESKAFVPNKLPLLDLELLESLKKAMTLHLGDVGLQRRALLVIYHLGRDVDIGIDFSEIIQRSMRTHSKDARLQEYACDAIFSLGSSDSSRSQLLEQGLLEDIRRAIENFPTTSEVQRSAFGSLSYLNNKRVVETGLLPCIQKAMELHISDSHLQQNACALLRNLACDGELEEEIVAAGFMMNIQEAMLNHPNDPSLQLQACNAVINLTINPNHDHHFIMPLILKAMANHPMKTPLLERACLALRNLLSHRNDFDIDALFIELGALDRMNDIINNNLADIKALRVVIGLFQYSAFEQTVSTALVDHEECMDNLLRVMTTYPEDVIIQRRICRTLWNVSAESLQPFLDLFSTKIFEHIVKAMTNHSEDAKLQTAILGIFANVCSMNPKLLALSDQNVWVHVKTAMETYPDVIDLQLNGTRLIANAIRSETCLILDLGFLPLLKKAMSNYPYDDGIQQNAVTALHRLTKNNCCYIEMINGDFFVLIQEAFTRFPSIYHTAVRSKLQSHEVMRCLRAGKEIVVNQEMELQLKKEELSYSQLDTLLTALESQDCMNLRLSLPKIDSSEGKDPLQRIGLFLRVTKALVILSLSVAPCSSSLSSSSIDYNYSVHWFALGLQFNNSLRRLELDDSSEQTEKMIFDYIDSSSNGTLKEVTGLIGDYTSLSVLSSHLRKARRDGMSVIAIR